MKKHLSFLMLLAALVVPWASKAQGTLISSFPWTCGFENATENAAWTFVNSSNAWCIGTAAHNGGSNGLYVSNDNGTTNAYSGSACVSYAYVQFVVSARGQYALQFDWKCQGESTYDFLRVAVSDTNTALPTTYSSWTSTAVPTGFMAVDGGSKLNLQGTQWQHQTSIINVPAAGAYRLVFVWRNDGTVFNAPPAAVDNVSVSEVTCPSPVISIDNLLSEEVELSWDDAGAATSWMYRVNNSAWTTTSDNSLYIDTLSPQTTYTVSVRAYCGGTDTSLVSTVSFTTPCAAIEGWTLPWTYGFEDASGTTASATFNSCLGRFREGTTTNYPYPSSTNHSGTKSLYMYSSSSAYSWLVLPLFDEELSELMLSFYAYRSTTATYGHWAVGVMSNPSDFSTFDTIATGQVSANSTWELVEVPLAGYDGNGGFLAILCPSMSAACYTYIDDITVDFMPDCVRPVALTVTDITTTSATLNIDDPTDNGYYMLYINGDSVEVSGDTYDLTDLQAATTYQLTVKGICGDGTMTNPISISFATPCEAISNFPWTQDFDLISNINDLNCWNRYSGLYNDNGGFSLTPATSGWILHSAHGMEGSQHVKVNIYGTSAKYWIMTPEFAISSGMELSFDYSLTTFSSDNPIDGPVDDDRFIVFAVIEDTIFEPLAKWGSDSTRDDYSYADIPNTISSISFPLDDFDGETVRFAFYGESTTSGDDNDLHIDNIYVGLAAACAKPASVWLDSVSPDEAFISWYDPAWVGNYVVEYYVEGSEEEAESVSVNDTTVYLSGLEPNTVYMVNVMGNCGELSAPRSMIFRTACVPLEELPWTEDFESVANGSSTSHDFAPCMNRLNNGTQYFGYPYVSNTSSYNHTSGGTKGLYWYNTTTATTYGDYQCVVLPAVDTDLFAMNTLQVRFWARATGTSYYPVFQVGVMTDPDDISTFQLVQTVNVGNNTDYEEFTVPFGTFEGFGQYAAIRALRPTSSWYATVDDITLEEMPNCPPIVNLTATPSVNGALLTWNYLEGYNAPESYNVTYDSIGSETGGTVITVTTNAASLTGLEPNTSYKAYIEADCGNGELGRTDSIIFITSNFECVQLDPTTADTVSVGNGTTTANNMPIGNFYKYSYTQQIVMASEMHGATSITAIAFEYDYATPTTVKNDVSIYMANVADSSVASGFVAYDPNTFQLVYTGDLNCTQGWNVFELDVPFSYNGISNLLIVVHDNSNAYNGSAYVFRTHSSTGKARYVQNDSNPYSLGSISATSGTSTNRANMKFYSGDCMTMSICAAPAVGVSEVTSSSVTIVWAPGADETSWDVDYRPLGTETWINAATGEVGNSYTIDELNDGTNYEFRVSFVCSDGVSGLVEGIVTAATLCQVKSLPYVENFENQPEGSSSTASDFIPCWTRINNGTTYGGYPYVNATSSNNHTPGGTKSIYFYASTTSTTYGDYMYAVLPRINTDSLPINTLRLSFWAKSSSTSYSPVLEVGVMDNVFDTNFTVIQTIQFGGDVNWREFYADFDNYYGDGSYVAIRGLRLSSTWGAYVDDIVLDVIPSCPLVNDLMASDVMLTSATVNWTDTSDNSGWNVEFDTVAFAPGTGHMTAIHVTDTFCVLTGLDSATTYHVYVYPDCDGDIFSRHTLFTTLAASPASVPYFCDFEAAGTNGWDFVNGSEVNHWMVGNDTTNNRALFITNDNINNAYTGTSASYVFAVRMFNLTEVGNYTCSFDWKANGESSFDFLRAALVPSGAQLTAGDYSGFDNTSAMPAGGIALDGANRLNLHTSWQTQVTEFNISTPGVYKMVFLWRNDPSVGNQPPAAIDNVELRVNTCPAVTDVTPVITSNSIDLTWPVNDGTAWLVTFDGTTTTVNTPAYSATGLTPQSDHTVAIRVLCGAGDTSTAFTETYHTPCVEVSLPYIENFDAVTTSTTAATGEMADCWSYIMTGTATYQTGSYLPQVYYSTSYPSSGSYCLRLYGVGYHMLPPMPVALDSLQLTFSHYHTSSSYGLEVGVMEGNTFIPIQVIENPTSTHSNNTVYFGSYTGSSRIIAFHNFYTTSATTYYTYNYIDDVVVNYLPNCPPVTDITAVAAGTSSITVDWIDLASSTMQWQVRYGAVGGSTTNTMTVAQHPVTITGLDTLTSYNVEVRPICSSTDSGDWAQATLTTEYCESAYAVTTGPITGTTYYTPVNNFYKYSFTETIIDSAELAGVGQISAIAFNYSYSTAMTDKDSVTIWLQPTNKSVFTSSSDAVALDSNTALQVYQGPLNCSQGWNYFVFDTPYNWNGHTNLLIIVDDNSNDYDGNSYVFKSSSCTGYKTLHYYSDTKNPDPTDPASFTGTKAYYQYRATMKLVSCGMAPCEEPLVDSISADETTAYVSFSGNAADYELAIVEGAWDDSMAEAVTTYTTSAHAYTFTGLDDGVAYTIAIRGLCGVDRISDWTTVPVTTLHHPCFVPTGVTVSDNTYDGATVSWEPGEEETDWEVKVFCASPVYEQIFDASDTPSLVVTGLDNGVTYSVTVRAMCDDNWYSEWSDTVELTTSTCPQVTGVNASNITATSATVNWTATGAASYEVEYGFAGFQQGNGTPATSTTNSLNLTGLEEQTSYDVYIRGLCAEGVISLWSAKYTFTTPEQGGQGIDDVESGNVTLFPNPASSRVAIRGIESESIVTVVDLNGREVYMTNADNNLTIDVTGYAKGTYFVRVTSATGTTVRKLIVQ